MDNNLCVHCMMICDIPGVFCDEAKDEFITKYGKVVQGYLNENNIDVDKFISGSLKDVENDIRNLICP